MSKNYFGNLLISILFITMSCDTDDSVTALPVVTNPDEVVIAQNSQVDIQIFNNDSNIPQSGNLSFAMPSLGSVAINTNNTPENIADDYLIYSANPNQIGNDSFQYTICDGDNNCYTENVSITITSLSTVSIFDGDTPHETLSAYNFFDGNLKNLSPTFGVYPYDLITPLFSDYAKKKRFIWMPNGVMANYINDYSPIDFPVGTFLIKNFYYNNVQPNNSSKLIETRLMYKKTNGWDFANYVWNDEQTEAFFTNQGSTINISWFEDGASKSTDYRIPSRAECFTCHNNIDDPTPIGMKPQNLNKDYNFNGEMINQLQKLSEVGYLNSNFPNSINTVVSWEDESESLNERVRAYLDINCAHCHSDSGHCNYRPMRFEFHLTENPENIGVCVDPDTQFIPNSKIVAPNDIDLSILYYRISTTDETFRMPLLGRTINHREGIDLIEQWINSLDNCN